MGLFFSTGASAEILIKYMAFLKGQCASAKHNDDDFTELCKKGAATNTSYQNGRVAFGFVSEHPISFSGTKDSQPAQDRYLLEVDQVTIIDAGTPISRSAVGSCSMSGDIAKRATITCDVTVGDRERYVVVFESIGSADLIYGVGFEPFEIEKNIAYAIREFDRIYTSSGIDGIETYLKTCYPSAVATRWLPAVIKCASVDFAGNWLDMLVVKTRGAAPRTYFTEAETELRVKEYFSKLGSGNNVEQVEKIIKVTQYLSIKTLRDFIQAKSLRLAPEVQAATPAPLSLDGIEAVKTKVVALSSVEVTSTGTRIVALAFSNSAISSFMRQLSAVGAVNVRLISIYATTACGRRINSAELRIDGNIQTPSAKGQPLRIQGLDGKEFQCATSASL